jgi:hypothetical protein
MFGQLGFFHRFAGKEYEDKRPLQRYLTETRRLLNVQGALAGFVVRPAVARGLTVPAALS